VEELTEVLNHVISLGLSVHQNVKANSLLEADNGLNLLLDEFLVFFLGDLALAEFRTGLTDFLGLLDKEKSQ
jgi:hypothetical protein